MPIRLLIFDFDGTLADTQSLILASYQGAMQRLGLPIRSAAECKRTIGLPLAGGWATLYPDFDQRKIDICVNTYREVFDEVKPQYHPPLFPGVYDTLCQLYDKGLKMTIASSRSYKSLMEFCHEHGIDKMMSMILGADNVAKAKPDPEPVICTLRALCMHPEETMVIGDMPVDIAMGKGAGAITTGVTYGNASAEDLYSAGADYVTDDFRKLTEIITDINR